jgi:hypothetical protein
MTGTMLDDDDCEEQESGPSLAIPPLYVLRTADDCPECGKAMHVYTLGCSAFCDADGNEEVEDFFFLRVIRSVPEDVLKLLKPRCPNYFLDHTEERERPYLINHCDCGAMLDDFFLHGDVGAAFMPDTPEGYSNIKLFMLPIDEAIPVESSYTLGGDEYLDFDDVADWPFGQR